MISVLKSKFLTTTVALLASISAASAELIEHGSEFLLLECTKGELVAAGSDNNVLRWARTGGLEQQWKLLQVPGGKFYIRSFKNGQALTIQSLTGNAHLAEMRMGNNEQMFSVVKAPDSLAKQLMPANLYATYSHLAAIHKKNGTAKPFEYVIIQESTRNEQLAIGSNGNALRWAAKADSSQIFVMLDRKAETDSDANAVKLAGNAMYIASGGSGSASQYLSSPNTVKKFTNEGPFKLNFNISSDANNVFIAFRGTVGDVQWAVNGKPSNQFPFAFVNGLPTLENREFAGVLTHTGWPKALLTIYPTIVAEMKTQGSANKNVYITGHSLGGALAGHLAYLLMYHKHLNPVKQHRLVTFGAPRYAPLSFAAHFEGHQRNYRGMKAFSVEIQEDSIPPIWYKAICGLSGSTAAIPPLAILLGSSAPYEMGTLISKPVSWIPNATAGDPHSSDNYLSLANRIGSGR